MLLTALLFATSSGCFRERSFAIQPGDFLADTRLISADRSLSTADWLEHTHTRIAAQLPGDGRRVLLTRAMRGADNKPVRVRDVFALPDRLESLVQNGRAIEQSAQVTGPTQKPNGGNPDWAGFEDVWIPVDARAALAGRLGLVRDASGRPQRRDCVVVLPGLLGDNSLLRTRDICMALRAAGVHALALEPRGFGQTARRFPALTYTYGILDTGDLLTVAEWLQSRSDVRETGLIGFSWGANTALLAAWEDGRPDQDPDLTPAIRQLVRPSHGRPHFRAGVIAYSPVLRFEALLDKLAYEVPIWLNPVLSRLQAGVRERGSTMEVNSTGDLRRLIQLELRRAGIGLEPHFEDGYRYLRFLPYAGRPVGNKLQSARVPVLIVQAANDPLDSAQAVVDLIAGVDNPSVAAIVLPGGGHNGFAAYSRPYFYSLMLHFFGAGQSADAQFAHTRISPLPPR